MQKGNSNEYVILIALVTTCILSFAGLYYVLYVVFPFSKKFSGIIYIPTVVVTTFSAAYGYYLGYKRRRAEKENGNEKIAGWMRANKMSPRFIYPYLSAVTGVLSLYFLYNSHIVLGIIFAITAVILSVVIIKHVSLFKGKNG